MFKEIFAFVFHNQFTINPLVRYNASNIGNMSGVNELKRDIQIVVSIAAKDEDFDDLELTLYSIFNQTISPDRIILWISDEYELSELPYYITRYIKNGLEVRFIADKGDYTNIIYAFKEFSNCIIITAENGIYYSKNWLKKLYHSYISNPKDIHVHRTAKVKLNKSLICSCKEWNKYENKEEASHKYFPILKSGVLYPPNCFTKEIFREDIYKKSVNASADIWIWVMALLSGRKIRLVKKHIGTLASVNILKLFMDELNSIKFYQNKDKQINKLMEYYGQNINQKLHTK